MALIKKIVNPDTGHINEYWKPIFTFIDVNRMILRATLGGYGSAEARMNGYSPDAREEIEVSLGEVDQKDVVALTKILGKIIYTNSLKSKPREDIVTVDGQPIKNEETGEYEKTIVETNPFIGAIMG